nr:translation initiation factor IF-2-like [Manis javanica]
MTVHLGKSAGRMHSYGTLKRSYVLLPFLTGTPGRRVQHWGRRGHVSARTRRALTAPRHALQTHHPEIPQTLASREPPAPPGRRWEALRAFRPLGPPAPADPRPAGLPRSPGPRVLPTAPYRAAARPSAASPRPISSPGPGQHRSRPPPTPPGRAVPPARLQRGGASRRECPGRGAGSARPSAEPRAAPGPGPGPPLLLAWPPPAAGDSGESDVRLVSEQFPQSPQKLSFYSCFGSARLFQFCMPPDTLLLHCLFHVSLGGSPKCQRGNHHAHI